MRRIALRGMPRSGTHLAEQWLVPHISGLEIDAANRHKHLDNRAKATDGLLQCVKHPLSWMVSMHRYSLRTFDIGESEGYIDHCRVNLHVDFTNFCRENASLLIRWNEYNTHWYMGMGDWYGCNYEALIAHPETMVQDFANWTGIIARSTRPLPTTRMTIPEEFNLDYYYHQMWRGQYTKALWGVMAAYVDPGLVARFTFDMEWR